MGFRFRRSLKIAPDVRLNVSKSGTYADVRLPGSGLSYRQKISGARRGSRDVSRRAVWLMFGLLFLWIVWLVVRHWPSH